MSRAFLVQREQVCTFAQVWAGRKAIASPKLQVSPSRARRASVTERCDVCHSKNQAHSARLQQKVVKRAEIAAREQRFGVCRR